MQRCYTNVTFPRDAENGTLMLNKIAEGSIDQTFQECHYYRTMQMHKECFDALVQFRIEKVTRQSKSYGVFLKIFGTHQRITKGLKTTVNSNFLLCSNFNNKSAQC